MSILAIVVGGVAVFLYLASQSSDNADAESSNTSQDFSSDGSDVILMTTPDRQLLLAALADGIAHGEGYYAGPKMKAYRQNNPGDIKVGNSIATFKPDTADNPQPGGGWAALYHQLSLNLNGSSHVYTLDMTLGQMVAKWIDYHYPDDPRGPGESTLAQFQGYLPQVLKSLNDNGFPATEDTTLQALAAGDFSG